MVEEKEKEKEKEEYDDLRILYELLENGIKLTSNKTIFNFYFDFKKITNKNLLLEKIYNLYQLSFRGHSFEAFKEFITDPLYIEVWIQLTLQKKKDLVLFPLPPSLTNEFFIVGYEVSRISRINFKGNDLFIFRDHAGFHHQARRHGSFALGIQFLMEEYSKRYPQSSIISWDLCITPTSYNSMVRLSQIGKFEFFPLPSKSIPPMVAELNKFCQNHFGYLHNPERHLFTVDNVVTETLLTQNEEEKFRNSTNLYDKFFRDQTNNFQKGVKFCFILFSFTRPEFSRQLLKSHSNM